MNTDIANDTMLIARCGLYCGSCGKYIKGKCAGCAKNEKATWCKIRTCCATNQYQSCADCKEFNYAMHCKKFNNVFSKLFALVFKSDRQACLNFIKEKGYENFAAHMSENKLITFKK